MVAASPTGRLRGPRHKTPSGPRALLFNELPHAPDDLDLVDGGASGKDIAL